MGVDVAAERRLQLPIGMRDVLFSETQRQRVIEDRLAALFNARGGREVRPPTLERAEVIAPVIADETSLYKLIDRGGRTLALRPDLTASVARIVATHFPPQEPLRIWYSGQVFRFDGQGYPHEWRQAGVEWFGEDSAAADAGIVSLAAEALGTTLQPDQAPAAAATSAPAAEAARPTVASQVVIGHTAVLAGLWDGCNLSKPVQRRLQQALLHNDHVGYEAEIATLELPSEQTDLLRIAIDGPVKDVDALRRQVAATGQFPQAVAGLERLQAVIASLPQPDLCQIDLGLARDFTYYTGLVLEGYVDGVPQPVLTGGRYDDLLGAYGSPRPALGFALNMTALAERTATNGAATDAGEAAR